MNFLWKNALSGKNANPRGIRKTIIYIDDIKEVCWKFPINYDIRDIWQKGGRDGRGPGRTSRMILLLPYWAFDHLGVEPKRGDFIVVDPSQASPSRKPRSFFKTFP